METRKDIEILFSDPEGVDLAVRIAEVVCRIYYQNDYDYLPFAGMEMREGDGWFRYPCRNVDEELFSSFENQWKAYKRQYLFLRRDGPSNAERHAEAEELLTHISRDGCRFVFSDCSGICQSTLLEGKYFEDFFYMLCFYLAVLSPKVTFEGRRRVLAPADFAKRILSHAVYDGKALIFEQMSGDPGYSGTIITWTLAEDRFVKRSTNFPSIKVSFLTDNDSVKQDEELARWADSINTREAELVSARPGFANRVDKHPHVMLLASSRKTCEKYRDEALSMAAARGWQTELHSYMFPNECLGTDIVIPDSVTVIGENAFRDFTDLRTVTIPDSVTCIDDKAFQNCSSLEEIVIPDSVTEIRSFVFHDCLRLKKIVLSRNLRFMGSVMFGNCHGLESIDLPASLEVIDSYAFSCCIHLKRLVLPDSVRSVGNGAFEHCRALREIVIPESVTEFGKDLFPDCSPDLVIKGKKGSGAEACAADNHLKFESL